MSAGRENVQSATTPATGVATASAASDSSRSRETQTQPSAASAATVMPAREYVSTTASSAT